MRKEIFIACVMIAIIMGFVGTSNATLISYLAPTGQTAQADFSFLDDGRLQIILTETTPIAASSLSGAGAILTSIGFLLPGSAVIVLPGTVTIATDSSSVGFATGTYPAGTDVSGEWGATIGGEKPISDEMGDYDFVSANTAQVTKFAGVNLDGPAGLNGPQGGLLDDSANRGGLGVIDNSVIILLTLQGLSLDQRSPFLASLSTSSVVEYGSDAAFGTPVPEPGTLMLLGSGLIGICLYRWRRKKG